MKIALILKTPTPTEISALNTALSTCRRHKIYTQDGDFSPELMSVFSQP